MTRSQIAEQKRRVERAFAWIQRRFSTHFEIVAHPDPGLQLMSIDRSARGRDDLACFVVTFNPEVVSRRTWKVLRQDALHELLHAMSFDFYDHLIAICRTKAQRADALERWENLVYRLEEKLSPWLL